MKKTLTFLPVALCAALALTFSACSSDSDDEGGSGGGGGNIAEKYRGDYQGTILEEKAIKQGDKVLFDKVVTKGGGTSTDGVYPCEWDYLYSDGKKIGAVYCSDVEQSVGTSDYCFFTTGATLYATMYYDSMFEPACGIKVDYSDIDSSVGWEYGTKYSTP